MPDNTGSTPGATTVRYTCAWTMCCGARDGILYFVRRQCGVETRTQGAHSEKGSTLEGERSG